MNQLNIFNWPLWVVLSVISLIVYFLFFGAAVNKALHNDRFISALNFIEIGKFYLKIGVKRTVVLIIVGIISINFIEISVMGIKKDELENLFPEFEPYLGDCYFTGCSHRKEKGCAVIEAVENGDISRSRHESYLSMYKTLKAKPRWEKRQ